MLHHSAHIGGGMCIVAHGWAHGALWCATERRGVLCSSQHVFFMSQGEGREPGFKFQVPRYFAPPQDRGDEPAGRRGYDKRKTEM